MFYLQENFGGEIKNIILLGDSILNNKSYVSPKKSIVEIIEDTKSGQTYCYARDSARIFDVYKQIELIKIKINDYIFLSIGGNDILNYFENCNNDDCFIDNNINIFLSSIFDIYKDLVQSINIRFPNNKIYLLDIYYPIDNKYSSYYSIIYKWNNMLYEFASHNNNNISGVLKISSIFTSKTDFIFDIEPSETGGHKIAENIIHLVSTYM